MGPHALILILSLASLASGCTENEFGVLGCEPSPNLCRVVCTSAEECAFENAPTTTTTGECATTTGEDLGEFAAFDDTTCQSTCEKQDGTEGKRCRFWRYDTDGEEKTCALMADDQCTTYLECAEGAHQYNCQCGDLKCPSDEGDPVAPGQSCKAPIAFISDHVHWGCFDPRDGETLSAYSPNMETLPPGTICTTSAKCSDWDNTADTAEQFYRKLRVNCDGGTGKWTQWAQDNTGGDPDDYKVVLGTTGQGEVDGTAAILEPACLGGGVELVVPAANIQQAGVELVCDTPVLPESELYTIKAPNTCLLLCDHHLGMTIESVLKEDGDVVFQNEDGEIGEGGDVKCW